MDEDGPYADGRELGHNWRPPRLDASLPHPGRMFNYLTGGKDNFQIDRDAVELLIKARPDTIITARAVECFTRRSVMWLAQAGIRQFIQLGQAITFAGNRTATAAAPDVRAFVYVADDPISLAYARALLASRTGADSGVYIVDGDFRDPERVLTDTRVSAHIDLSEPVGILMFGMLDFIASDRRAKRALDFLMRTVPAGSMAALFHVTEVESEAVNNALDEALSRNEIELTPRSAEHVRELVDGYEFLDPGLVPIVAWHPDDDGPGPEMAERTAALGGVIVKRTRTSDS